jgi:hypothetical protein
MTKRTLWTGASNSSISNYHHNPDCCRLKQEPVERSPQYVDYHDLDACQLCAQGEPETAAMYAAVAHEESGDVLITAEIELRHTDGTEVSMDDWRSGYQAIQSRFRDGVGEVDEVISDD